MEKLPSFGVKLSAALSNATICPSFDSAGAPLSPLPSIPRESTLTRVVIPVGVAYGSDTERARGLLIEQARSNPLVMEEPGPSAIFRRFGESSLDFELRVFIADREHWPQVVDRLHSSIDDAFRKAGIEIAFPQRDVHIRSTTVLPHRAEPEDGGG